MGTNYPDVVPGQPVEFSAQRENDIRHLLKSRNGIGAGAFIGGQGVGSRLKVYNDTDKKLSYGAVSFANGKIVDGAIPAKKYNIDFPYWGVLIDIVDPQCFGTVIVSGPVEVEISSGTGKYAKPSSDGKTFVLGNSGAMVLSQEGKKALVLLGASDLSTSFRYDGFFAVEDTSSSEKLSFLAHGGETDIGICNEREFNITSGTILYLLAEYHSDTQKYSLKLTISPDSERTSNEYTLWKIATIHVSELKTLEIQQHWTGGIIYFSSRFWI